MVSKEKLISYQLYQYAMYSLQYEKSRAVQRLIAINHIQNKILCLHDICVRAVYNYCIYMNTYACMYLRIICMYI